MEVSFEFFFILALHSEYINVLYPFAGSAPAHPPLFEFTDNVAFIFYASRKSNKIFYLTLNPLFPKFIPRKSKFLSNQTNKVGNHPEPARQGTGLDAQMTARF
jgi:hypothetical protein